MAGTGLLRVSADAWIYAQQAPSSTAARRNAKSALEQARWPDGFLCPSCEGKDYGLIHGRRHKRYQCRSCCHQDTLTAGTILEATKLPLNTWFLAFYLVGQAKTGISSLALMRRADSKSVTSFLVGAVSMS
jgi:transposase-like protein